MEYRKPDLGVDMKQPDVATVDGWIVFGSQRIARVQGYTGAPLPKGQSFEADPS